MCFGKWAPIPVCKSPGYSAIGGSQERLLDSGTGEERRRSGAGARYRQCPPWGSAEPLDGGGLSADQLPREGAALRCAGFRGLASPPLPLGTLPPRQGKEKLVPQLSPLAAAGKPRLSSGPHHCYRQFGFGPHHCHVAMEGSDGCHAAAPVVGGGQWDF